MTAVNIYSQERRASSHSHRTGSYGFSVLFIELYTQVSIRVPCTCRALIVNTGIISYIFRLPELHQIFSM